MVDGVVTDDSDAFLFGAKTVYKNIFDEKKYVEAYLSEDAERELGVSRNEFVSTICAPRMLSLFALLNEAYNYLKTFRSLSLICWVATTRLVCEGLVLSTQWRF